LISEKKLDDDRMSQIAEGNVSEDERLEASFQKVDNI